MDSRIYRDLLRANLKNNGVWCSIDDAIKTERAIIAGKIVLITSGVNLCYELVEMYPKYNANRSFQIRFPKEFSQRILSLSLKKGDCFAICNTKIDLHRRLVSEHSEQISLIDVVWIDPSRKRNTIENIYYKRQNSIGWSSIPTICSPEDKFRSQTCRICLFRIDLNNMKNIVTCLDKWHAIATNDDLPPTSHKRKSRSLSRVSLFDLFANASVERDRGQKTPEKNIIVEQGHLRYSPTIQNSNPKKSQSYFKPLLDNFLMRNMPVKRDIIGSHTPYLTKLVNLIPGDRVNIIVILRDMPEKPLTCASDKYVLKLNVCDESREDEFLVRLIRPSHRDFPVLKPFNIMLFNKLKVDDESCGSVGCKGSVIVFDKDNPYHVFAEPNVIRNAAQIQDRVEELRQWMFKTIPISRPFTSFCSFELKNDTLNLRCRVIKAKEYPSATTMILRIEDGTISPVAVILYALNTDSWSRCYNNTTMAESSGVIDILVQKVQKRFVNKVKSVNDDEYIELYGVLVRIKNIKFKTTFQHCLELSLNGDSKNVRVQRHENDHIESWYRKSEDTDQPSTSTAKPSRTSSPSNILVKCTKRRRLLDEVVRNLSMLNESDKNLTITETPRRNQQNTPSPVAKSVVNNMANNSSSKKLPKNFEKVSSLWISEYQPSTPTSHSMKKVGRNVKYLDSEDEDDSSDEIWKRLGVNAKHKKSVNDREEQKAIVSPTKKPKIGPRSYRKRMKERRAIALLNKEIPSSSFNECTDVSEKDLANEAPSAFKPLNDIETRDEQESLKHASHVASSILRNNEFLSETTDFINNEMDPTSCVDLNLTEIPLENDIIDKWPVEVTDETFRIRVRLKTIAPEIHKSSNDKDLLQLVYAYCEYCNYCPMNASFVKWITKHDERVPACRVCLGNEKESILEFLLMCELLLEDSEGKRESVLAQGPFADKILGCTLEELHSKSTREKVLHRCRQLLKGQNLIVYVESRLFKSLNKRQYFLK